MVGPCIFNLFALKAGDLWASCNSTTMQTQTPSVNLSCIRPHLEYACTVWDPHLTKDITLPENAQKFACKICCKSWVMDYESMLTYLDIPSLQQRRLQLKANMMYQYGGTFIPEGLLLPPSRLLLQYANLFLFHCTGNLPEQTLTKIPSSLIYSAVGIVYQRQMYVHQVVL